MIDRRRMSGFVGALALLCSIGAAYGQEDYTTWAHHATVTLNTTSSGANVTTSVTNFPVLLRLNSANFPGFNQLLYSGNKPIDIRFSKGSDVTRHLPYQIEYYSPTKDTAVIWVLADSIWGNDNSHSITMYYGKSGVFDSSNGAKVFDTQNGYLGVWHLGDSLDATYNGYNKTNSGNNPTDTMGIIGHCRAFNGTTQFMQMGTTSSSISSSNMLYGGPWTLSAWVYFAAGSTGEMAFVGTGDHAYQIERTAGNQLEMEDYSTQWERIDGSTVTLGAWHHVYAVRAKIGTATHNMPGDSFYIDGVTALTALNTYSNGNLRSSGNPFTIGKKGDNANSYMKGYIDEVEMSTVARSKSWAFLSYQNQRANQTLVGLIVAPPPLAPALSGPTNGAVNQPFSPTLSWNSVSATAGTVSYNVQVSTTSAFSGTIISATGVPSVSLVIGPLSSFTTYFWKVSATDDNGTSPWSNVWSFTTIAGPPQLATPSNNAQNQPTTLALNWDASGLAFSYEVQVSQSSAFTATVLDQSGLTTTNVTILCFANSTTYYWRVFASNAGGATAWSAVWSFTTVVAAPTPPLLASPTNNAQDQPPIALGLSWGTAARATSYEVEVSLSSTFAATVLDQSGLTLTYATVSGLASTATYYWRANASNIGGSSLWSSAWSFSTEVGLPIRLVAGWNMKSLNVHPTDSTTAGIFSTRTGSNTDPKGFLLVKDVLGNTFIPSFGIHSLGTFTTGCGYQIYTDSADVINVTGTAVAVSSTPISLPAANWSIIGYLPQVNMLTSTIFAGIVSKVVIVKDNQGEAYLPYLYSNLDTMRVGEGYLIYTTAATSLTYPTGTAKQIVDEKPLLSLPAPRHYAKHRITGSNATLVAKRVEFEGTNTADTCEVGAFDSKGNLVGAGTVIRGLTGFAIWGDDPQTKGKDGCDTAEEVSFRLWNGTREYPLEWVVTGGGEVRYATQGIFIGNLAVPAGATIHAFNLARVYPNPFRGFVRVAFDVPTINGVAAHDVEINIFNLKGILVHQLAKGKYNAGHYEITWNGESSGDAMLGSSVYMVQMKANGFDKRLKLVRVR